MSAAVRNLFVVLILAVVVVVFLLVANSKQKYLPNSQNGLHMVSELSSQPKGVGNEASIQAVQGEPMALSLDYWEQTGNALKNLIDLQCWAKTANISKVVEPSIRIHGSSVFRFAGDYDMGMNFGDLFDKENWNNMSLKYNYSVLVPTEYFLKNATKELVFVQILYISYMHCRPLSAFTKASWYKYLTGKGFRISRTECADFHKASLHYISEESFQKSIFKGRRQSVLFDMWEGVRGNMPKGQRVGLKNSRCSNCLGHLATVTYSDTKVPNITYVPTKSSYPVLPSQKILQHLSRFVTEYLAGEKYIAVMLRTEKFKSIVSKPPDNNFCVERIKSDWSSMKERYDLNKTLIFSDAGKHGSMGWSSSAAVRFSKFLEGALNSELPIDKVDSILENITGSKNSVQIAVLNSQLVAHATCVLMVGGGTFQTQTLAMYSHYHRGQECYSMRDGSCNRKYVSHVYGREI